MGGSASDSSRHTAPVSRRSSAPAKEMSGTKKVFTRKTKSYSAKRSSPKSHRDKASTSSTPKSSQDPPSVCSTCREMERKYETEKRARKRCALQLKKATDICFDLNAVAYMLGKYNDQQKDLLGALGKCITANGAFGKEEAYVQNANAPPKRETIELSD